MQIPTLGGLFDPVPYKAPEDAIERNLRTLGALQDPRGTLETLQSDKVIKQMADLKTEGIGNLYSEKALQAIKGFQDYSMSLYKSRKGFNRLTLSAEQQLDEKNKYRDLLFDINALKELTKTYNETMQEVARDVRAGIMTPENYREFEKLLDEKIASAKTIRDQPDARAVYNNFLTEKPEIMTLKKQTEFAATMFGLYKQWNYTEGGTKGRDPVAVRQNIENSHPSGSQDWAILDSELTARNFYPAGIATEDQKKGFLTQASISGYNPSEGRVRTNIYNEYGVSHPKLVNYVKDGDKVVWDLPRDIPYTKDKVPGWLTGVYYENGKFYGEFSIDEMVPAANISAFDLGNKVEKNRFGNDVYRVELDASDYSKIKNKGYRLEDEDKYGWNELSSKRTRTSKAKGAADQTEAEKLGL